MGLVLRFDLPSRHPGDDGLPPGGRRRVLRLDSEAVELPQDHPDVAVVQALRSGDTGVFESVYLQHAPAVYEFVQGYVDADVAHDVVQDVFLALWKRRTTIVIARGVRAYLFGAARLRALQVRRNRQTGDALNTRVAPDDVTTTADVAERAEVREAVTHALMTLPGRTRELLALRWVYGMSYTDAAAILGVSPDAAKKLGRRAEVALAPLLERFRG